MDTFYSLNKLLSTLPFSILGYYEHDKELDDFFERLCDSDFISKKNNIELVSYSYAKIKNRNEWETKSLSQKFFFHALNEKYSLLALNAYYSIRNKLFERKQEDINNSPHLSNNVAIVLSRLFLKDVGFRLKYTEEKNWHFSFLEQNQIFSIQIPLCRLIQIPDNAAKGTKETDIFRSALGKFLADSVIVLKSKEELRKLLIQKVDSRNSSYEKKDVSTTPIDRQFEEFIKAFKPIKELKALRNEFIRAIMFWHRTNPEYLNPLGTVKHVLNWSELFFQIAFISLVYNSWIEYFPSVCGINEKEGKREYRNLGGLILGYKLDDNITLTQEERSIFRIISSRISSTVAGQWLFENDIKSQIELNRNKFNEFCQVINDTAPQEKKKFSNVHSKYLHGNEECENASTILKALSSAYKDAIGKEFTEWVTTQGNKFSKYLTVILSPDKQKNGEINTIWNNGVNHFCESCNTKGCVYCSILLSNCISNSLQYYLNLPLINKLIIEFETYPNTSRTYIKHTNSVLSFEYSHEFNLNNFLEKLKTSTTRSFTGLINDNYYSILAMCDFYILSNSDKKFILENWLLDKTAPKEQTILNGFSLNFELKHKI